MKNAYFAGGCFWCIANVFYDLDGVKEVVSGYSGGREINPKYEGLKVNLLVIEKQSKLLMMKIKFHI